MSRQLVKLIVEDLQLPRPDSRETLSISTRRTRSALQAATICSGPDPGVTRFANQGNRHSATLRDSRHFGKLVCGALCNQLRARLKPNFSNSTKTTAVMTWRDRSKSDALINLINEFTRE